MADAQESRVERNDPVAVRLARHAAGIVIVIVIAALLGIAGVFPVAAWVVPVAFVAVSLGIAGAYRLFPTATRSHATLRAAAQSIGLTVVSYATGWGFLLTPVHLFAVADNIDEGGSGATTPALAGAFGGTLLGQVAIAFGLAPIAIEDVGASHLLAVASLLVLVLIARRLERAARASEDARAELARREARFRALVEDAADVVLVINLGSTIDWSSPSTSRVLGRELPVGEDYLALVHEDDRKRVAGLLDGSDEGRRAASVFRLAGPDDEWIEVEGTHRDLRDDPAVGGIVASLRDVSERERLTAEVERSRTEDALTGLANRAAHEHELRELLSDSPAGAVSVMEVHVGGLRAAVLAGGRDAGDRLLREAARQLEVLVRPGDHLARIGDATFALLLDEVEDRDELLRLANTARNLVEDVGDAHGAAPNVAVAIATSRDSDEVDGLQQCVGIAAQHALAGDEERIAVFDAAMRLELEERITIERGLPQAVRNDQLRLAYQPLCRTSIDGTLEGVEALVRWDHPEHGPLSPGRFIPIAEQSGSIVEVGRWVLRTAASQLAAWDEELGTGAVGYMSINVSARQLQDDSLPGTVSKVLDETGLRPDRLVLELTESALAEDAELAAEQMNRLSDLGVRLALDDFGTGWASMASLQRFPFHVLKIDRSFVAHASATRRPELLRSMVALGRSLGLKVVAEGVEHEPELIEIRELGCDLVQGWLLGRPAPPQDIAARLGDHRRDQRPVGA